MENAELEAARRDAVHRLCVAQAREVISVETFEHRLTLVQAAPSAAAVQQLTADVGQSGEFALEPYTATAPVGYGADADLVDAPVWQRVSCVFSKTVRSGQWLVPQVLEAKVMFGELTVDLRDAEFAWDTFVLDVDVTAGALKLVVPPGTRIDQELKETMSGTEVAVVGSHGAEPNGLTVRLVGQVRFGSVEIKQRRPTSSFPEGHFDGLRGFFNRKREGLG